MTAFAGRRIAVVGAAGGIGHAIAARLAADGALVVALDKRMPGEDLGEPLPERVDARTLDVTSAESVERTVAELYADDPSPIDLVNSAGIVENDVAAEELPIALYDSVMAVNLRGVFLTCQAFGRRLLDAGGGAIVNIASMSGNAVVNAPQRQSVYNTSKAGVSALTRSLAVEWGPRGVRVNALSPGYVDTPLNALKQHMHAGWRDGTVAGRFATVDEVAGAVAYLLGDEAGYFHGAELLMDGGYSLR
ncbi:SDR family NAD(P)-dependent oxidoreductase [Gryllotalpicola reticulitermitis]|uniref:SDR family NAD(P)-dependent oxidoreductase n=1 Tax=Gryllotalpicola reticulitermitis TaxID=1184153 RepID=A0ABV8Q465_9MICO